jgi:hypothetical protein
MASRRTAPRSAVGSIGSASAIKKTLLASEQHRPDVALRRQIWTTWRQPFMSKVLERLVFIDETSLNTKMTKTSGWAPVGQRLIDHAPFGHWNTQTFIAALRHDGLTAPWVIDRPINRRRFKTYLETQLIPTLTPGDLVVLDNLSSHKSAKAREDLKAAGGWRLAPGSCSCRNTALTSIRSKWHLQNSKN